MSPYPNFFYLIRAGKSSIAAVVFHKTPPAETLYTESTTEITQDGIRYYSTSFSILIVSD